MQVGGAYLREEQPGLVEGGWALEQRQTARNGGTRRVCRQRDGWREKLDDQWSTHVRSREGSLFIIEGVGWKEGYKGDSSVVHREKGKWCGVQRGAFGAYGRMTRTEEESVHHY
jgi:hypothetical protein